MGQRVWVCRFGVVSLNGEGMESQVGGSFSTRYGQREVAGKEEKVMPYLGEE